MADAVIGALRVVIGADSAALDKNLNEAQSSFSKFGRDMTAIAGGIGLEKIIEKSFNALTHAVKQGIEQADQFGKAAQKFGIPVEQLSALSLAAAVSDVSMDTLGKSLGKLSKTMVEAAAKPTSEAANAFKSLGIEVTDSNKKLKPTDAVLSDIAGAFSGLKDGAGKTQVAMALFGRSGAELIPLLNSGKTGLKEMTDEAAKFGLVISKETSKSADAFNNNLIRLGLIKDGIILKITAGMLPALENLSKVFVENVKSSGQLDNIVRTLTNTMNLLVSAGIIVGATFSALGSVIGGVSSALALIAQGKFSEALSALKTGFVDIWQTAKDAKNSVEGLWDPLKNFAAWAGDGMGAPIKALNDYGGSAKDAKNALDTFLASQIKHTAAVQADVLTTGLATGEKEKLRIQLQANAVATEAHIAINEAMKNKINEVATAAGEMALKLKGAQLILENKLPHEKLRQEIANNEEAMRKMGATAEEVARANEKAAEKMGMAWANASNMAADMMGSLSRLTGAFAKENKAMGIASKAFGIGQAIINTAMAITKALAIYGPTPWGYAAAAVAAVAGAAQIATISMQHFKTGADFIVPGGIGGGDRVPFNAMLEPGEHVQITPNSARPASGGATNGGDRVITVRFEGDDLGIGQKVARRIVTALNEVMRDGARLKVA